MLSVIQRVETLFVILTALWCTVSLGVADWSIIKEKWATGDREGATNDVVQLVQLQKCDAACIDLLITFAFEAHTAQAHKEAQMLYKVALTTEVALDTKLVLSNNLARLEIDRGSYEEARARLTLVIREIGDLDSSETSRGSSANLHTDTNANQRQLLLASAWNNLGLLLHYQGREEEAMHAYSKAMEWYPTFGKGELLFNSAVSHKNAGFLEEARNLYVKALEVNPLLLEAEVNLAALLHENFFLVEAVERYERILKITPTSNPLYDMALNNLGVAHTELGHAEKAIEAFSLVLSRQQQNSSPTTMNAIGLKAQILGAKRVVCNWTDYTDDVAWLKQSVREKEIKENKAPSLLPFDSLLLPLSGEYRLQLAAAYSKQFEVIQGEELPFFARSGPVRVGYLSYDFTDHPTAHLVEELFVEHTKRDLATSITLSYGKNDQSIFRHRIQQAGHEFHDISHLSHGQMIGFVKNEAQIEVLVDMQGYTRGGRPEVVAARPAPIIVNFLVFAGTSGASFIDYFVADRFTAPLAEYAPHFSERLVLLPDCYQVNSYSHHLHYTPTLSEIAEQAQKLRNATFVFANFNKSDKIEPASFRAWMTILRKTPGSVLWLLEPSRHSSPVAMMSLLRKEAHALRVDPSRLVFANRISKAKHIARHRLADLFLDSFVYGAHSTATDAIRGGLPVLTVAGDTFATRVASSLLQNMNMGFLVTEDIDSFVETAIRIAASPALSRSLKDSLKEELYKGAPLFNLEAYGKHVEIAYQSMVDLRTASLDKGNRTNRHIIVAKS